MFLTPGHSWRFVALVLLALAAGQPARAYQASPQPRTLEVPATISWQHAETLLILPPSSAGLRRAALRDNTADEIDVVVDYANEAEGLVATVYLFKTAIPSVPLWFDRALGAIRLRPGWGLEAAPAPAVSAFARPGSPLATGLRASLDVGIAEVRSTALAVTPLGTFLVKVRLSSTRLDATALDAQLTRFVEGLHWPPAFPGERAAVPVEPCPNPLRLRRARVVHDDVAQVLGNLVTSLAVASQDAPVPVYCREPGARLEHAVYRADGSRDAYLIALGDSGIAISVSQAMDMGALLGGGSSGRRYAMALLHRESTSALPSFNRLPPPEQALAVAFGSSGPGISVSTRDQPER